MPSPVTPSEFCSAVPSGTSSLCDRIQAVFLRVPRLLCTFFEWMINEDGTLTDNFIREVAAFPVGVILPYASTLSPAGWLVCNGNEVSRTTYSQLFAVIGTKYGLGNGTTTFNLPNLKRKFLVGYDPSDGVMGIADTGGEETHTLTVAEMPSHTHNITADGTGTPSNGHGVIGGGNGTNGPFTYNDTTLATDHLSIAKAGLDQPHQNMPPWSAVSFIIRY